MLSFFSSLMQLHFDIHRCYVVNKRRPTNIDIPSILSYQLPLPGIISILHRISGFVMFLAIPVLLYILDLSLESEATFEQVSTLSSDSFFCFLVVWAILGATLYHMVAGIKHLFMDAGYGETLEGVQKGSKIVIAITAVLVLILGVWLW